METSYIWGSRIRSPRIETKASGTDTTNREVVRQRAEGVAGFARGRPLLVRDDTPWGVFVGEYAIRKLCRELDLGGGWRRRDGQIQVLLEIALLVPPRCRQYPKPLQQNRVTLFHQLELERFVGSFIGGYTLYRIL